MHIIYTQCYITWYNAMILGPWLDQDTLDDVRTKLAELENEVGKVSGWDGNPTEPEKIADRLVILLDH